MAIVLSCSVDRKQSSGGSGCTLCTLSTLLMRDKCSVLSIYPLIPPFQFFVLL
ncbi:hypothetical protein MtrunA17_Chr1g0173611 [Medicago truncatula]|uniref:Uncharacterized protein n=1 Tax=Medicago truncatula TaxID=3880 RepID=I3S048_MEDTR|nr:unknown [Medicago truncatula]RHN79124.1 hypothetical protein MtrunA17_Chr1g0173611 [Medicago truncatula]